MAPSKLRKAIGAVKDQTSIGLAKVSGSNSITDLYVAIIKATRHEERPAEEKHIREILNLTCYSHTHINVCVDTLSKRLNKTRNWIVALKTLMLIERLLSEGDPTYEQEVYFGTRRGIRVLNMSDFRDKSQSSSWDFSAFVRMYALYLDERLEFRMLGRPSKVTTLDDEADEAGTTATAGSTPICDTTMQHIFTKAQQLQQLLERFLACRPTGAAKNNRLVFAAIYRLVKESNHIYFDVKEIMDILFDQFVELKVSDCVKAFEIFSRTRKQFDELDMFYNWCKVVGIARSSEYLEVEKITRRTLEVMEEFIRDKSAYSQNKMQKNLEPQREIITEEKENDVPESEEETNREGSALQGDLLKEESLKEEEKGDNLALVLTDGSSAQAPEWVAFRSSTEDLADWETALVQSASNLSKHKVTLGGGFDMLLLDSMYQYSAGVAHGFGTRSMQTSGSASSVAFGATTPTFLALPAPPVSVSCGPGVDPFVASLGVPPPTYVQMSEIEKRQQLLVEEQVMWQQYASDGMRGQIGMAKLHTNSYTMGGYTRSYWS